MTKLSFTFLKLLLWLTEVPALILGIFVVVLLLVVLITLVLVVVVVVVFIIFVELIFTLEFKLLPILKLVLELS